MNKFKKPKKAFDKCITATLVAGASASVLLGAYAGYSHFDTKRLIKDIDAAQATNKALNKEYIVLQQQHQAQVNETLDKLLASGEFTTIEQAEKEGRVIHMNSLERVMQSELPQNASKSSQEK